MVDKPAKKLARVGGEKKPRLKNFQKLKRKKMRDGEAAPASGKKHLKFAQGARLKSKSEREEEDETPSLADDTVSTEDEGAFSDGSLPSMAEGNLSDLEKEAGEEGDESADDDQDEDEEENYEGPDWLADDDEEAWASSDDESPEDVGAEGGAAFDPAAGIAADSPAAQKEFRRVLKQRLMKDKEFLSFLLQESEKQQADTEQASDAEEDLEQDDEEGVDDDEEASEHTVKRSRAEPEEEDDVEVPKNLLTSERYEHLCHLVGLHGDREDARVPASPSLRCLQLFLGAFRSAVRQTGLRRDNNVSSEGRELGERTKDNMKYKDGKKKSEEGEEGKKRKPGASSRDVKDRGSGEQKSLFLVKDEELRRVILLRTVQQLPAVFRRFLQAEADGAKSASKGAGEEKNLLALTASANWSRLRLPLRWVFSDVCQLLVSLQNLPPRATKGKEVLVQVLLSLARKNDGLVPFLLLLKSSSLARRFLLTVGRCWAFTKNEQEQFAAFAALRQLLVLRHRELDHALAKGQASTKNKPREGKERRRSHEKGDSGSASEAALKEEEKVQEFLQTLLRIYQQATSRNVGNNASRTWRGANRVQLLLNEYLELLKIVQPRIAYRVAYQSIRELALTVRSIMVVSSQTAPSAAKGKKSKAAFLHARRLATSQKLLYSWAFLSTARLWGVSFASTPSLRPLAFPLVTLLCAALKVKLASLSHVPFCLNILYVLHQTSLSTNLLIPLSAYVFALLELLLKHQEMLSSGRYIGKRLHMEMQEKRNKKKKKDKKFQTKDGGKEKSDNNLHLLHVRDADPEVTLRLSAAQQDSMHVIDGLVGSFQRLLTEHLGYLVLHPAFPEISLPIKRSLRRTLKLSRSLAVVRALKTLLGAIEGSAAVVQSLRCELKELPVGAVEIFTEKKQRAALPLFKLRLQVVEERRKFVEEKVKGEISAAAERREAESAASKTARQLKRERQKQRRETERRELEKDRKSRAASKEAKKRMRDTTTPEAEADDSDNEASVKRAKRQQAAARVPMKNRFFQEDVLDEIGSDLDDL